MARARKKTQVPKRRSKSRKSRRKPGELRGGQISRERHERHPDNGGFASLRPNAANFTPLSPVSFLKRAAEIHPKRCAVIHGTRRHSYRELYDRARRLASALRQGRRARRRHGFGHAAECAGDG